MAGNRIAGEQAENLSNYKTLTVSCTQFYSVCCKIYDARAGTIWYAWCIQSMPSRRWTVLICYDSISLFPMHLRFFKASNCVFVKPKWQIKVVSYFIWFLMQTNGHFFFMQITLSLDNYCDFSNGFSATIIPQHDNNLGLRNATKTSCCFSTNNKVIRATVFLERRTRT